MADQSLRTLARQRVIQALYQWQLTDQNPTEVSEQFLGDQNFSVGDGEYFQSVFLAIVSDHEVIKQCFMPHLDRPVEQLDPIAMSVLMLGTYELQFRDDVPYRVAINEAVELAKSFGPEASHKFVNGVLDKVYAAAQDD